MVIINCAIYGGVLDSWVNYFWFCEAGFCLWVGRFWSVFDCSVEVSLGRDGKGGRGG